MDTIKVIKIGGNIINDADKLSSFLGLFSQIEGNKILVHGGGKIATELASQLGVESKMIEGRRITDAESLKIVTMVYAGLINKNIVAQLQALNCNAVGLTGADGNVIPATKRNHPTIDFGFVGDIVAQKVNTTLLENFFSQDITPIFCALTHDEKGNLLNTNADTIAATLAIALSQNFQTFLVYCFEKKGVLKDVNDENSVISSMNFPLYQKFKSEGVIHTGMIPKLDNAFDAIKQGVTTVYIKQAEDLLFEAGTKLS